MESSPPSVFERHPRTTLAALLMVASLGFLTAAEIVLRRGAGLGTPPLYVKDPACGFRPRPDQSLTRFHGARFRINNLGLRAERDWDPSPLGKVLFLGDSVTHGGNHISGDALFSAVAGRGLPGFEVANGGVPSWGVENVHGLVVGARFLPAEIVVTTLIENDFFRGLVSGENQPHIWYTSPRLALVELGHFIWSIGSHRLRGGRRRFGDATFGGAALADHDPTPERARKARRAARKLREMDAFIRQEGFEHLIFISPTRSQVLGEEDVNPFIRRLLEEQAVPAVYLLERLDLERYRRAERARWFQDRHHLTDAGHRVWGEVMAADLRARLDPSRGARD